MKSVFIIAEAGVNHNGDIKNAFKLIDVAVDAGVDAIKFQTFNAEKLVSRNAEKADYQKELTGDEEKQLQMLKKLELSFSDFTSLNKYCTKKNIIFLSTAFDEESITFLDKTVEQKVFKIPSGEVTNLPYLIRIAKCGKPVIMSTGMCDTGEIDLAVKILRENSVDDITLLHCTTEYPTPYSDVNLLAMNTLEDEFKCHIGYSDHTVGIEVAIAAVALGAGVIEKHFTLDRNMPGPDHSASIEPDELKQMVKSIRNIEIALGDGVKRPTEKEIKNRKTGRKSIVAKEKIEKGEVITAEKITTKRPGTGISPMEWDEVIGKTAKREFMEDELIEF